MHAELIAHTVLQPPPRLQNALLSTSSPRAMSFARTKIQPPRPRASHWIERGPLEQRLADALAQQRLVLISAAAGYGKSTALTRLIARWPDRWALAWVSADEGDDLHRLLECLVAALEPFDLPWRTAPEALITQIVSPQQPVRVRACAELINALDACDVPHGVIVLDDLHRIDDGAVHEFLDHLLERLSPRWTLAIATRQDPPLALARLRALGELAEFRQADLQFSAAEVHVLAHHNGLADDAAAALLERTQGWPAGLRLAISSAGHRAPLAADRVMFDFLTTEVIDRLEPDLRRFLLRTSVLPELTAARAAAVSGDPRAVQWLEAIDRLGLFVTVLEGSEVTLKLHDLFREALEQRLAREHASECPVLWQRAAAGESDPARRMTMLLRAGDLEAAAQTLRDHTGQWPTTGALAAVSHGIDGFPGPFVAQSPALQHVLGLLAWTRWDFGAMAQAMARAEAGELARQRPREAEAASAYQAVALNALGRNSECGRRLADLQQRDNSAMSMDTRVVTRVAAIWHALDLGQPERVAPLLEELVDLLERADEPSLWYRGHPLPRINGLPGTAAPLQRWAQGALRCAGDRPLPVRAMALTQTAWHHAWQHGDVHAATEALLRAEADARWLGNPVNVQGSLQLLQAFVPALRGDAPAALQAAQALIDEHAAARGAWSLWGNTFYAARIAARFDDAVALRDHLALLEQTGPSDSLRGDVPLLAPLQGHLARIEGRSDDAVALWERALEQEDVVDRLGQTIEIRLHLAAARLAQGRLTEAAAALLPVFARVAAGAGVGGVLLAPQPLAVLARARWGALLGTAQVSTLQSWQNLAQAATACCPEAVVSPNPGGLSQRELEVLSRMAAGDSNKLIARVFDLSPHTVKRHVANILDKLGVDTRGQAAAWYLKHA